MKAQNLAIEAVVEEILPIRRGVTKGGKPFERQQVILRMENGKYPLRLALNLWDANLNRFHAGQRVKAFLSCEMSKTNQGDLINNLTAYRIFEI